MKQLYLLVFSLPVYFSSHAQQGTTADFTHLKAQIQVDPVEREVRGDVSFQLDILKETDSIFIDAHQMEFNELRFNDKKISFYNDGKRLWLISDFKVSRDNELSFTYSAAPKKTMYFIGENKPSDSEYEPQVWTQGQGKNTSHWLPSFDDVTEKLEFDLSFLFPSEMEVISNGKLVNTEPAEEGLRLWEFDMDNQMSSYLVAVAAGAYYKKQITSAGNVPISLYFYPGQEEKVEPTYRYTKEMFDFLVKETGVAFPWADYKQIPVRDFLYSGMENTGATIFSDIFLVDSTGFIDRNYVMVNAHELAHQWFGDLVTAASGEHHWLQEGFATYYALLAEKHIHGEAYYYWKLYITGEQLKEMSDAGKGESLMNPKAGSITFYQKGAWALHILREQLGEEAFRTGVQNYLETYKYSSATIDQFIQEMEAASGKDLSGFVDQWLRQSAFPGTEALSSLKRSEFIKDFLDIAALKSVPIRDKRELLSKALDFPVNDYIGQEVVQQLALEDPTAVMDLYRKAFSTNNLLVRQTIALSVARIPEEMRTAYESLLEDDSYVTKEAALYNLWMNFPENRSKYLDRLKGVDGYSDKNIRTLWLALNLATPQYNGDTQSAVYTELSGYTAPQYPYLLRENAFKYLFQLNSFTDENLKHLLQGSQYHINRFRSFTRDMIKQLLENPDYVHRFKAIAADLPLQQQDYLKRVMEE